MPEANAQPTPCGAVFFDRDGTLIRDTGYLHDPALVELLPGVKDTLHELRAHGFLLFLFTNQSGVARGYFTMDDVRAVNLRLSRLLGDRDEFFDGTCVAPEHPDEQPVYRKPCPRYILETMEKFGLAPETCYMVGDRTSDLEAGLNAGIGAFRYFGDLDDAKAARFAEEKGLRSFSDFSDLTKILLEDSSANYQRNGIKFADLTSADDFDSLESKQETRNGR